MTFRRPTWLGFFLALGFGIPTVLALRLFLT
jgi:hypothetical protein